MASKPLISVAIATYNGEKHLRQQLDSILSQSYDNFEIIVSDDRSTDSTQTILDEYRSKHNIQYQVNKKNIGYIKNFETLISLCTGDYIALSDQDDIWLPEKLEKLINNIGNNLLIHSDASLIDENDNLLKKRWKGQVESFNTFEQFLFRNIVTGCTILFKRELLKTASPFPEGLAYHDWWLAISSSIESKITYINEPLILYRQHTTQHTGANTSSKFDIIILDKIRRAVGKKTFRMIASGKHLKNLYSIKDQQLFSKDQKQSINDIICYHENIIHHYFHPKSFFLALKYRHIWRQGKIRFFMRSLIIDIFG